jgi:hypothetical protein
MAYTRKTRDTWELHVNYGSGYEHEVTEYSRKEIRARVREYRENCPEYALKVRTKREKISPEEN